MSPQGIIEAIAKLLGSIAWPIVAFLIARRFHKEIAALLSRMTKGKVGSAEFEFAKFLEEVDAESEIPREQAAEPLKASTVTLASQDPRAAILTSWLEIEASLTRIAEHRGLLKNESRPVRGVVPAIRAIQRAELLDQPYVALIHDLRTMRNEAAHSRDFSPPTDVVLKYITLANEVLTRLHKISLEPPAKND